MAFGFHEAARLLPGTVGVEALPELHWQLNHEVSRQSFPEVLAIVSTLRYVDCMFKLPDFPSVDFSKFDVEALRNIDVSKYVPAVNFPKVELPAFDVPGIDVAKLTESARDFAYLTVGLGVAAGSRVLEAIRSAA